MYVYIHIHAIYNGDNEHNKSPKRQKKVFSHARGAYMITHITYMSNAVNAHNKSSIIE